MANNLIISYDLNAYGQDYAKLEVAIKQLGPAVKLLTTLWYVRSELDHDGALDRLIKATDRNDEILIVNATGDAAASAGLKEAPWRTLVSHWTE